MKMNDTMIQQNEIQKKPSLRIYIIVAGIILLLITPVLSFILLSQEQKPDPAIEKVIRNYVAKALNKDPNNHEDPNALTDEDFAKITKLSINPLKAMLDDGDTMRLWGIPYVNRADIRMLKNFTNLQEFELVLAKYPKEKIPKWMEILDRYGIVNLEKMFFIDIKPLENMIYLKKLNFTYSDIKNIEPLSHLENLENLNLSGTKVSDIKLLMKLKNLRELNITDCKSISEKQVKDLQKALPDLKIIR
jgi:Leucine-rich repeat (LRR) protein